jgi:3-oxoacyl-[acyl-carrier-protein] synthase-1
VYPLTLSRFTLTTCLGSGLGATRQALLEGRSGLTHCRVDDSGFETFVGQVPELSDAPLPRLWSDWECRNNRLAYLALHQDDFAGHAARAAARYGAHRVGVLIGTTTSGIRETEEAFAQRAGDSRLPTSFRYRHAHAGFAVADFVRSVLGFKGPATVISTACSSSAKVFPAAARMIACGVIDAAVVGGVDTLCSTTLFGFRSLELLAPTPCRPFDADRSGLSLGEAGAFVLLERAADAARSDDAVMLLGAGESSDAYHMSTPHPDGLGARFAIEAALESARLSAHDVDYVNLHGTGTRTNDTAEDKAIVAVLGARVACSSTKGATGHALGAAGAVEAVIAALAIQTRTLPGGVTTQRQDPALRCNFLRTPQSGRVCRVLSNSFGFGGTNCALLFGAGAAG